MQIVHPLTGQLHYVWFENPTVLRPLKDSGVAATDERLFPRDCREGVRHTSAPAFTHGLAQRAPLPPSIRASARIIARYSSGNAHFSQPQ